LANSGQLESDIARPSSFLPYLATAHRANPDAEVSGPELQQASGLDVATGRAQVAELARQRLVKWDPLLTNIWVRITHKGWKASKTPSRGPEMVPTTSRSNDSGTSRR
jgi:hypothetical protein